MCPTDSRRYVVRGFMPLVGSPKANRSWGRGQTKRGSEDHYDERHNWIQISLARTRVTGAPSLEPGLGVGLAGERLVAGPTPTGPGRAQPERETWDPPHMDPPPMGGAVMVGCSASWVAAEGGDLGGPILGCSV